MKLIPENEMFLTRVCFWATPSMLQGNETHTHKMWESGDQNIPVWLQNFTEIRQRWMCDFGIICNRIIGSFFLTRQSPQMFAMTFWLNTWNHNLMTFNQPSFSGKMVNQPQRWLLVSDFLNPACRNWWIGEDELDAKTYYELLKRIKFCYFLDEYALTNWGTLDARGRPRHSPS